MPALCLLKFLFAFLLPTESFYAYLMSTESFYANLYAYWIFSKLWPQLSVHGFLLIIGAQCEQCAHVVACSSIYWPLKIRSARTERVFVKISTRALFHQKDKEQVGGLTQWFVA